jgi:hypothetical protein
MPGHLSRVMPMSNQKLLRRKDASKYLEQTWGVIRAASTLAKYAVVGGGPAFQLLGRVPYYSIDTLDKWVLSELSAPMRSTSDTASKDETTNRCPEPYLGGQREHADDGEKRTGAPPNAGA